ncbi:MAG: hypothetical protein A2284_00960 [Deltaproteobacteria bacterium RIFOXYA12_FULL_61_11]|nr:MAG: hypothetical protein A2284_00960 [Deltaproteobacteria bacterium RIFOXYA12_FULL_61_11]
MTTNRFMEINTLLDLMPFKVQEILLVANLYDAFILEKDGHLAERIWQEYSVLNLLHVPRVTRVGSAGEVAEILEHRHFDLVITMMDLPDTNAFGLSKQIKTGHPKLPVVLLLSDPSMLDTILLHKRRSAFDGVFFWNGNTNIFFAIIKYIEDKLNVAHDVAATGFIKLILLVEDSVDFYSKFLPILYSKVMQQTQLLTKEGIDDYQKIMGMKTRPKILLCHSVEEAQEVVDEYGDHLLAVLTDTVFYYQGHKDKNAGAILIDAVRVSYPFLPFVLMSSQAENRIKAEQLGVTFLHKKSSHGMSIINDFLRERMGFGPFNFHNAKGESFGQATTLREFHEKIAEIPDDCLLYHALQNHFSLWLTARGEHEIAFSLRPIKVSDLGNDPAKVRHFLLYVLGRYREAKQSGLMVQYRPGDFESNVIHFGGGPLGGKARSVTFGHYLLGSSKLRSEFRDLKIRVPRTICLSTDEFDTFIEQNELLDVALEGTDSQVLSSFLAAELPDPVKGMLVDLSSTFTTPLAVRSSSLLEDSRFLPFAGIYATYMLPNNAPLQIQRIAQLERAIKLVYASTYLQKSKAYFQSTPFVLEDEKMGVLLQEVVGHEFKGLFYPTFSGVAQSYNFYPVSHIRPSDGVVNIALGLGNTIVGGGKAFRYCPVYPEILPQFSSMDTIFENSQKDFYALDLRAEVPDNFHDELDTLVQLPVRRVREDRSVQAISSIFEVESQQLRPNNGQPGPVVLTFENIVRYETYPLSRIVRELLDVLTNAMAKDVEIEFAVDFERTNKSVPHFYLLQARPLVVKKEHVTFDKQDEDHNNIIVASNQALGNGILDDLFDIVVVKRRTFTNQKTREIAEEIATINRSMEDEERRYLLIGIGRLGTADPFVGIPLTWDQISQVGAIVEAEIEGFYADPSQGSHFFQNITSRSIPYFSLQLGGGDCFLDWDYLEQQIPRLEQTYTVHLRTEAPVVIKVDGKRRRGVIRKPLS